MGSCCSKRNRRSDSHVAAHASAILHPSLDNWKVHNIRPPLSELDAVPSEVDSIPVMWAKPTLKPPFSFPSIHYNINSNLLCDSNHSSSRSLGTSRHHAKSPAQPQVISRCASNEDSLPALANKQMITSHHELGRATSARHHDTYPEPDKEALPAFSFATQPYVEPDFFNSGAFAFHPATQSARLSTSTDIDCIKLQVRHKHMFPEDFQALQSSFDCAMPPERLSMRRSRSVGKLPEARQEVEGQHHRRSFHETARVHDAHNIHMSRSGRMMAQLSKESNLRSPAGGDSSCKIATHTFTITDMDDDYSNDEDNDNFVDINVAIDMSHADVNRMPCDKQGKEGDLQDMTSRCISLRASASDGKSLSREGVREGGRTRTSKGSRTLTDDEKGSMSADFGDFEFKQSAIKGMYQKSVQFTWEKDYDWQRRHQATEQEHEDDQVNMLKQQLSVVPTGDAILLSGSDSEEFHLIPSRYVSHDLPSPPTSPRVNLSPLRLMSTSFHHRPDNMSFSVEDIMLLLESENMNEDDLLSLLINSKSSPSRPPSESLPMSATSSSSVLTSSSASSLASSSSSSSSSSSPRPWFPCPSAASPGGSSSKSLMSTMPVLSPFSSARSRSSSPPSQHYPLPRRMSPHPSFEFKVKSYNSAASTPMFSPIRASTKRNIAHLKPTALTTEEIAEIWGVFEQRQQALVGQRR